MSYLAIRPETIALAIESEIYNLLIPRGRFEYSQTYNAGISKFSVVSDIDEYSIIKDNELTMLESIYKAELTSLSGKLNTYHNKNISESNWELLLGPWLKIFISMMYSKWALINKFNNKYKCSILIEKNNYSDIIPLDFNDFHMLSASNRWNGFFESMIADFVGMGIVKITPKTEKENIQNFVKKSFVSSLKMTAVKSINFVYSKLSSSKVFIMGVPRIMLLIGSVFLFLRVLPLVLTSNIAVSKKDLDIDRKFRFNVKKTDSKNFHDFIKIAILANIPRFYLEDYKYRLQDIANWPSHITNKYIFTSVSHWNNDFFKLWTSNNKTHANKLVIFQHGGTYGTTKNYIHQEYIERKIADYYLTWGWGDTKKNIPFVSDLICYPMHYKLLRKKEYILIVSTRVKFAISKGDPWDSSAWNRSYIESIVYIYKRINNLTNGNCLFRLHPAQKIFGCEYIDYLNSEIDNIKFDNEKNYNKSIFRAKLTVATQNSTVLLKCLVWNLPIVCYFDETLNPLNNTAKKFFELLEHAGIFHKNKESVVSMINRTPSIDRWWNSGLVQNARKEFCSKYASTDIKNIYHAMKSIKS